VHPITQDCLACHPNSHVYNGQDCRLCHKTR
jgi:hypothetical protein